MESLYRGVWSDQLGKCILLLVWFAQAPGYEQVIKDKFSSFSTKTYIEVIHKNYLNAIKHHLLSVSQMTVHFFFLFFFKEGLIKNYF